MLYKYIIYISTNLRKRLNNIKKKKEKKRYGCILVNSFIMSSHVSHFGASLLIVNVTYLLNLHSASNAVGFVHSFRNCLTSLET